ncbi:hypothetical protein GIB67_038127 [Kingdonia uniflora]|uniref:Protein kinase domain-containing protein n=1 Tax=Kingdonia uniflora TaxID=39325 RepID=A0A7J7M1W9_9MAGN|nr:hypothetical protein GIB67_038127 [Kingdonia uniflora]
MKLCFMFILCFTIISVSTSKPHDFEALLAFKASSDHSNSLKSWSNSSKPCSGSWIGVTCKNNNRVTQLVLQNLNLTGSIELLTRLTQLRVLSVKHNNLLCSSSSVLDLSQWRNMKLLYLSYNNLSGEFPIGVTQLLRLRRLDLSNNRFSGRIPVMGLNQLAHLITLRLEENSFTGTLESSRFETMVDFNVSYNKLYGEIPESLSSFASSVFIGNENLCGRMLPKKCSRANEGVGVGVEDEPIPVNIRLKRRKKFNYKTILAIVLIDVVAVIALVIGICLYRRNRGNRRKGETNKRIRCNGVKGNDEELVLFEGYKGYKLAELLKGSAEMLGRGSLGTTYKVTMDNGNVLVVKRVTERRKNKKREIEGILREIGALRHRNIASLRAYYCSKDELLLVFDYLPNESLHCLLHGNSLTLRIIIRNRWPGTILLDWRTRLKIASGVAEGLKFLHCVNKSKLFHGNLTSSNVLVDHEGNTCISDIAFYQLFPTKTSSITEYRAPELAHNSKKLSTKSDVYSFGVILLEILTGKMATEGGELKTSLVEWVHCAVKEKQTAEVLDFELLSYKDTEEEMMALLHIAFLCLTPTPLDRPKMSVVYEMIENIRARGRSNIGGTNSPSLS